MTQTEAFLMAIEALDNADYHRADEAITAIKAALEAKDEPFHSVWDTLPSNKDVADAMRMRRLHQLSTPPQLTWVGLTDDEIDKAWRSVDYTIPYAQFRIDVAKAVEAKLKEKNT